MKYSITHAMSACRWYEALIHYLINIGNTAGNHIKCASDVLCLRLINILGGKQKLIRAAQLSICL